mmetsp:Transcript_9925/g.21352  ORF Transcript_9925/g.21352 Transcript_9925/m.21352 type:complete len:303 (+) Transcript_9925:199-1107(+)|eukprot:CAMPEP_0171414688 /NCGR_PEP_ID=MMETSP0880-20121228/37968_1 /TAXON_ID=67004 /ORGANISM="Thalassiosira weissflogii, Strain CCMP1336" /LENGTH=302 /DNA_ID=CAMNT_0011932709 /DNA_START=284 /DNA_END=1192 /DNA_ORIENTATION=-
MNVVDNSVQSQFATLKKESDVYSRSADDAERERQREEHHLNVLQSSRLRLEDEIRVAHTELGTETRKKKILDDEKKRLMQTMDADRQAIINISSELKGIDADERTQKMQFVKEMESLNNELEFLLAQCENQKTIGLLDADTINWLVETKLNQKLLSIQSGLGGDNPDDESNFAEIEKWNEVISKTKTELDALAQAQEKLDAAEKEKGGLEHRVRELRNKFVNENGKIGVLEIDDLEAKWEQERGNDDSARGDSSGDIDMNENSHSDRNENGETVHMQLFYDSKEYNVPLETAHPSNASEFAV